jgi:signal transduction histidine kinase
MSPDETPDRSTESRFSRRLFAAFLVVAVASLASSVYVNWRSFAIGTESEALTTNALPSTVHLTAAVDGLRDLEAATDDYPDLAAAHRAVARERIEALWKAVDVELEQYIGLPAYPGERDLYADVPSALRELEGAIERLFADVATGDREKARATADHDVRARANRAAWLLRRLTRFNSDQATLGLHRIEETRTRVLVVDGVLNALTVVLTVGVALWMWRIFRSFAALQRAHARLVERRAEELEVFGRRVAHDLLSPLSSLTYCLSAFKGVSAGDPKLEDALGRARHCVQRAQLLVDGVFDFARSGGAPSPGARVEVRDVVEAVAEELRGVDPQDRPEVDVGAVPDVAVQCTRGVLASILGNLARNAVKFMRDSAVRRVSLRVAATADVVRIEVEDTGPGVPPGLERTIFQPYVRGEGVTQPGLGLGLATVKRFCEAYGGSVGVRSASGAGSVFHVTLPRARDAGDEAAGEAGAAGALPPVSAKMLRSKAG